MLMHLNSLWSAVEPKLKSRLKCAKSTVCIVSNLHVLHMSVRDDSSFEFRLWMLRLIADHFELGLLKGSERLLFLVDVDGCRRVAGFEVFSFWRQGLNCHSLNCSWQTTFGIRLWMAARGCCLCRWIDFEFWLWTNLVDPASSHMLVSKIKPCMSQYKPLHGKTVNGSLKQL